MLGLGALPSTIQFFAFLFMPESPRWLINRSRNSEAREALCRLRGVNSAVDDEYESIKSNIFLVTSEMEQRGKIPKLD